MAVSRKGPRGRPRMTGVGKRRSETFGRMGRPAKWREEYIELARKRVAAGDTDSEVADLLGVAPSTLSSWKIKVPELARAMKRSEENVLKAIEHAQAMAAMGYSHPSEKIFMHRGKIVRAKTEERFPPSTPAAKLILAAKKPAEYGDKLELAGSIGRPIEFRVEGLYDKDHPPPPDKV